jgi:hypothetical protein
MVDAYTGRLPRKLKTWEAGFKEQLTARALEKENLWDVRGVWDISCPTLHRGWDCKRMEMTIYLDDKSGKNQMHAEIDFGVVNGTMRFQKPARRGSTEWKV